MQFFFKMFNFSNKAQQSILTFKWGHALLFLIFLLFSSTDAIAQCTVSARTGGDNVGDNHPYVGQTFLACQDGEITSISVSASGQLSKPTVASTYHLYLEAEPGSGTAINTTSLANVVLPFALSNEEEIIFDLNTPFPVVNGTTYRFVVAFEAGGQIRLSYNSGGNQYTDGHYVQGNPTYQNQYWAGGDLDFQVTIEPPAQCTVSARTGGDNVGDGHTTVGQTFLACNDGEITSISVSASGQSGKPTAASTYHLYLELEPGSGTPINTTSLASVIIPAPLSGEEEIMFNLNTPFPVIDGTEYRFVVAFEAGGQIRLSYNSGGNEYTDGHFVEGDSDYWTNGDLDFQVMIGPSTNVVVTDECTISALTGGDNVGDGHTTVGQTFLACQDGEITSVSVSASGQGGKPTAASTYHLYLELEPGSGTPINTTSLASVIIPAPLSSEEEIMFNLNTPFPVDDGTAYRFVVAFEAGGQIRLSYNSGGNEYTDGHFVEGDSDYWTNGDLDFQVNIGPSTSTECTVSARTGGDNVGDNHPYVGQTFLACLDGEITCISVSASGQSGKPTAASTYHLYLEAEPGNGFPINTTSLASVVIPVPLSGEEEIKFNLDTPFPVVKGMLYRFVVAFEAGGQIRLSYNSGGDEYTDGHYVQGNPSYQNQYWMNGDLDFQVAIQSPANPSVPTLSEWGLIILALSFMTLGTLYLVQPSVRSSLE